MAYTLSVFGLAVILAVAYAANEDYPVFFLKNVASEKCIDVVGVPGTANAANVQMANCEYDWDWKKTDQIFGLQNNDFLVNRASLKCLDITGFRSTKSGTNLVIWPCSENDDHKWKFEFKGDQGKLGETFQIKSVYTNLCVGTASAGSSNIVEKTCSDADNSQWFRMVPATQIMPKTFFIQGYVTNKCIDVSGAPGVNAGSNIQSWTCENSGDIQYKSDQLWYIDEGKIWNRVSGLCIVVAGNNANGANINLGSCDVATAGWEAEEHPTVAGVYRFRNGNTNRCLEVTGRNNVANGVNIQQYDCQAWNFPDDHRWTLSMGPLNNFLASTAEG